MNRRFVTAITVLASVLFVIGESTGCTSSPIPDIDCPITTVKVGETVHFDAGLSIDGDESGYEIRAYEWIFPAEAYNISGKNNVKAKCKFYPASSSGVYVVTLKVTDDEGWSSQTTVNITVEPALSTTWYVKPDGDDDDDGHDWDNAFRSIDAGIGSAAGGDIVTGAATVILAMGAGKIAAKSIIEDIL